MFILLFILMNTLYHVYIALLSHELAVPFLFLLVVQPNVFQLGSLPLIWSGLYLQDAVYLPLGAWYELPWCIY